MLSLAEAAASAELRERGTFVDWDGVPQPAPAPRLSASAVIERPRSRWCGHTDQVLAELGYTADEVAVLRADEAVAREQTAAFVGMKGFAFTRRGRTARTGETRARGRRAR